MKNERNILQIGSTDWSKEFVLSHELKWHYFPFGSGQAIKKSMKQQKISSFDAVLIDSSEAMNDLFWIENRIIPYTLLYSQALSFFEADEIYFLKRHCAQAVDMSDKENLLRVLSKGLFKGQYGDKLTPIDMIVNPNFKGQVVYNGYENVTLIGQYGENFKPIVSWKFNIMATKANPVELWLEYQKDLSCEIRLKVYPIQEGSVATILNEKIFTEEDMSEALLLDNDFSSYLGITLEARGQGQLHIGALHQRLTRYQLGKYVLGGNILKDRNRQEINYFFYPGDFKPPLSVYFSGYRRAEGFEGFGMMKNLGTPFLLFSDPRVDGGVFYLGSDELEIAIHQIIQEHLDLLHFTEKDLILSGMSMGTFGAMYYGAEFRPRAIVLSKPLGNLGTIAKRGRLLLPKVFPTALDILHYHTGGKNEQAMDTLNDRFWKKFRKADFSQTIFGIAYMKEEDYDPTMYQDIIDTLYFTDAKIISKGISGRHNDDASVTVSWFINYYKMILEQEFGRKK